MTATDTTFLTAEGLLPTPLPDDPMPVAAAWLAEARERALQPNPNALVITTVGRETQPTARVVLCKDFVADPGYLVFYTNYQSRKAREIAANSRVGALFHWDGLGRQVRIEGVAIRSPAKESDAYFAEPPPRQPARRLGERSERARGLPRGTAGSSCTDGPRSSASACRRATSRTSRGRRTGAASGCGHRGWSSGPRATRASTTGHSGSAG